MGSGSTFMFCHTPPNSGLGTMPPQSQLQGSPQVELPPTSAQRDPSDKFPSKQVEVCSALGKGEDLVPTPGQSGCICWGRFPPVPAKLASKIWQGDFIEMGKLLSKFWLSQKEEDGNPKLDGGRCRSRLVTHIFTWLQCFSMYVSIRALHTPAMLLKLIAYMSHIIRVHQDYTGLAWIRYMIQPSISRQPYSFTEMVSHQSHIILNLLHRSCSSHRQMWDMLGNIPHREGLCSTG